MILFRAGGTDWYWCVVRQRKRHARCLAPWWWNPIKAVEDSRVHMGTNSRNHSKITVHDKRSFDPKESRKTYYKLLKIRIKQYSNLCRRRMRMFRMRMKRALGSLPPPPGSWPWRTRKKKMGSRGCLLLLPPSPAPRRTGQPPRRGRSWTPPPGSLPSTCNR